MDDHSKSFLFRLLETASPSGFEEEASRVWRAEAETFADEVSVDSSGNSYARLKGNGPKVMVEGHIDEIGLMISHIDDDGFLWFNIIGGWDAQVLVGQHIRISTTSGRVAGVVGRIPPHQMESEDYEKATKIRNLWIDIGAKNGDEARAKVAIGDWAVIEQPVVELADNLIAGRGLDNRIGAFVALETLRMLSQGDRPAADVWAVAPVQEEIGLYGAKTSAFKLKPDVAIAIDVTPTTDFPDGAVRRYGKINVGDGPVLARGASFSPLVVNLLVDAAKAENIPYAFEAAPVESGTDADAIARVRAGVPCGLVSIPNRYMHSPSELSSLSDMENCSRLIAAFTRRLGSEVDFRRI